jgi:uncharacterized protein YggU (UPF0235/DUF167 family)
MHNRAPDDTLVIAVRVRPGASRVSVGGRYDGVLGPALVVAVSAPAVAGRASEAVLAAVAAAFSLRPREVEMVATTSSRDKRLRLFGDVPRLAARFAQLLNE